MIFRTGWLRGATALTTAVVIGALALAVPLLDTGRDTVGVGIAAEHDGCAGPVDHDHLICVQHTASTWAAGAATSIPGHVWVGSATPPEQRFNAPDRLPASPYQPRSPPSVRS